MIRVAETREPDPANHALYEDLYRDVYLRMYGRLQAALRGDPADHGLPAGGVIAAAAVGAPWPDPHDHRRRPAEPGVVDRIAAVAR